MKNKFAKRFVAWLSVFGLRFLLKLMDIIPRGVLYRFGSSLTVLYYRLAHKNREVALNNMKIAFGNAMPQKDFEPILKSSFKTMGHIILDTLRYPELPKEAVKDSISIEGIDHLEQALKKGKGVIAASAHLGSFTIMGCGLTYQGYKTAFVARHARNKGVENIVMHLCRKIGQKIIFNRPVLSAMRLCIKALSRNEILIIELDQNFGTEGVKVNFFGHPAMVAGGPIRLALNTQAPILPMFIIRVNDFKHIIKIEPEVELDKSSNQEKDITRNLQKAIDVIEKYIREYPGQWVNWIHKQWDINR